MKNTVAIVVIRTDSLEQNYLQAIIDKGYTARLVNAEYFITEIEEFSSIDLVVVKSSCKLLRPILKINKKRIVTTLLIPDINFSADSCHLEDVGTLAYFPFKLNPINLVKYISILAENRKKIITKDIIMSERNRLINIAIGILMVNNQCVKGAAYEQIRKIARQSRKKIEKISKEIIKAQLCLNQFNCDYIKIFNDDKNCQNCTDLCPHYYYDPKI
ncbi:MAG TPA: ANTAR domain-containing protein [Aeromonadales bacterium]|nr:ANTAR domain-containing protein [Aeromonadales bacterium]